MTTKFDALRLEPGVFSPGRLYVAHDVQEVFAHLPDCPDTYLQQHINGQYGAVQPFTWFINDEHVMNGTSDIVSEYILTNGQRIRIVTDAPRERTIIVLQGQMRQGSFQKGSQQ